MMLNPASLAKLLRPYRKKIDAIDYRIVALLNRRAIWANRLGKLKASTTVYCPDREAEVLRHVCQINKGPLPQASIYHIFREIMSACLALEQKTIIAYLDSGNAMDKKAIAKHFGHAIQRQQYVSIEEVLEAVKTQQAHYAVVPSVNSVNNTLGERLLAQIVDNGLGICGEIALHRENIKSQQPMAGCFWVLSSQYAPQSARNKTVLTLSIPGGPQTLYSLLDPLVQNSVNILRLESCSWLSQDGKQIFILELEGHQSDPSIQSAVRFWKHQSCFSIEILGSYPYITK